MPFDITRYWYQPNLHPISTSLLPLAKLFEFGAKVRRQFYQSRVEVLTVPIIVVGNITVGGTGKTPFVIWLTQFLIEQGLKPGIISRGVGGIRHTKPHSVSLMDKAQQVGDEALLLKKRTSVPVVICVDRVAAAKKIIAETSCDVIISDDGLQHYRLHRDLEIIMVDGQRRLGNKQLLPAGPLRENVNRLHEADFVITTNGEACDNFVMLLEASECVALSSNHSKSLHQFIGKKIHAVAAIGHPERFFRTLRQAGLEIIPHIFPDHYLYQAHDLDFDDNLPIIMTEKDAVKCNDFIRQDCWYLPVNAKIDNHLKLQLLKKINEGGLTCLGNLAAY